MIFLVAVGFVLVEAGLSDRKVSATHHLLVALCFCGRHCLVYIQAGLLQDFSTFNLDKSLSVQEMKSFKNRVNCGDNRQK